MWPIVLTLRGIWLIMPECFGTLKSYKTYMRFVDDFRKVWREPEKRRFLLMRTAGNFLVLFALFGVVMTFGPLVASEARYKYEQALGVEYEVVGTEIVRRYKEQDGSPLAKLLVRDQGRNEKISPASIEFGIVIPKIGANAKVVKNVNAASEEDYLKALLQGVAHAEGTGFPGGEVPNPKLRSDNRKIYLFAHSTDNWWNVNRYNAVFFLLKELETGDEVNIFYNSRRFVYRATQKLIVEADEVEYLVEPSTEETLILQTCWPPGTTLKRLIIVAKPQHQFAAD